MQKRTIKLTVLFSPVGLLRRIRLWLRKEWPSPVLFEVEIEGKQIPLFEKRFFYRTQIKDVVIASLPPGEGKISLLLNPADFRGRWSVKMQIDRLNN